MTLHPHALPPPAAAGPVNRLVWLWQADDDQLLREHPELPTPTAGLLKTRTVLALAYEAGDFVARPGILHGQPALLLGQAEAVARADRDFEELMLGQLGINNPKAVVPTVGAPRAGWRRQFGWMALFAPQFADYDLVWHWLQPSLRWVRRHGSQETVALARQFHSPAGFRPMKQVFRDALTPPRDPAPPL